MKFRHHALVVMVFGFIAMGRAQTYISNLGTATISGSSVNSGLWRAQAFTTSASGTFNVEGITLDLDNGTTGGGFQIQLFSEGSNNPGSALATFSGNSDPTAAGEYTYLVAPDVVLSASTRYWIVASTGVGGGGYGWLNAASATYQVSNWNSDGTSAVSFNSGATWINVGPSTNPLVFEVTAVPEPSSYAAVGGLLALGVVGVRRMRRNSRAA